MRLRVGRGPHVDGDEASADKAEGGTSAVQTITTTFVNLRRRWPEAWRVFAALVVAAAMLFTVLNSGLLVLVVAGLVLGWAARSGGLRRHGTRGVRYGLGCLISLVVIGGIFFGVFYAGLPGPPVFVEVLAGTQAQYDESAASWHVRERLSLNADDLEAAATAIDDMESPGLEGDALAADDQPMLVIQRFGAQGWTLAENRSGTLVFERRHDIAMPLPPLRSDMTLRVPEVRLTGIVSVVPGEGSVMLLTTPAGMIISSSPQARAPEPAGALETREIPIVPRGGFGVSAVDLRVDGTVARWPVVRDLLNFSFSAGLGWFLLIAVSVVEDEIRRGFKVLFARFLPRRAARAARPMTILFLAANPTDTAPLRLDEEIRAIDEAVRQTEYRDRFDIHQQWAVRISDLLQSLLRHRPDIVHFSGHGSTSNEIILEDEAGAARTVPQEALGRLFLLVRDNVRCVVLNACYSEPQATAIAAHIDAVVGMSTAIGDEAAIKFASAFYAALGYGKDLQTAFAFGVNQIDLHDLGEEDTPKLITTKADAREIRFVGTESPAGGSG